MRRFKLNCRTRLVALVLAALALLAGCGAAGADRPQLPDLDFGVFVGAGPQDIEAMKPYRLVVVDAATFTADEVAALQADGVLVYSYLNIGSIEQFREGWARFEPLTIADYEGWPDERWMDVTDAGWQDYLMEQAGALAAKGADGLFLDNADVYDIARTEEAYAALVRILTRLGETGLPMMMNGGDGFLARALPAGDLEETTVNAVNQECVFTTIDFATGEFRTQEDEAREYAQTFLARDKAYGLEVYLTEYSPTPGAPVEAAIRAYCEEQGDHYYIAYTLDLDAADWDAASTT